MPAYIHHHDAEPPFMICPSCMALPMYIKDATAHWSMAKIELTYECSDCGTEVRQTVTKANPCAIDLVALLQQEIEFQASRRRLS